ncbi:MAG: DNA polymerase III subunit beta [Candidatus Vogelbacteria bacterium]|nr:DNA polymerase III subunit beta [Candidatus Vogelbacteria bacterium]
MNLECSLGKIKTAILSAERLTGKNLSLPVFSNIILEAENQTLKIKATNLDLGLEISLPCKINQTGLVAVSGNLLGNFFNHLPASEDKIKLELLKGNLNISSTHHTTTIKCYPADDFPLIPRPDKPSILLINSEQLSQGLQSVWYSASSSNLKPEISSVCFYEQPSGLCLVATDSFRLAEKHLGGDKLRLNLPYLILPLKNTLELMKIIENLNVDLEIQYNQNQISFFAPHFYLTSRLIDGVFPDYRQIIPTRFSTEVTTNRAQLLELLKLANVFVDKFNQADLSLNKEGKLEIRTINDNGNNLVWVVPQAVSGEPVAISLNLKYLLDGLVAFSDEQVILRFNGAAKPIMLTGWGDTTLVYLIMPIKR